MQVSVENLEGLERRMTVQVPAESIEPEVINRLKSLSPTVKMHGFRPGKVPFKLVKRLYGERVRQEVLQEVVRSSYQDALTQQKLRPANAPAIEPKTLKEGEALEYSVTFEVLPEFEVSRIEDLKVERPVVEISEADVNRTIENLRKQRMTWNTVERPAQEGDQLTVDYQELVDGEEQTISQTKNAKLILEENNLLKEFREKLTGLQAGAATPIAINYPEDYNNKDLASKTVRYQVNVNSVAEPVLPVVDEQFAQLLGITEGGVEALRQEVREHMQRELDERIRSELKRQLMDGLLAANDIQLPQALVKTQIESMAMWLGLHPTDDQGVDQVKKKLLEPEARRRTAFSLILAKLAETKGIQVDEGRVRDRLISLAARDARGAELVRLYERNPSAMQEMRSLALEEQMVDWLLERVQVTAKVTDFEDIMKPAATAAVQE